MTRWGLLTVQGLTRAKAEWGKAIAPLTELWCQRHTRTESASLRCLVTGHAPFFSSACHLGLDARFGVQDLALQGEPPVESPALAPPAAGFFFGPRAKPRLGNFVKSCKLLS